MATTADRVIVELEARTGQFDANVRTSARSFDQSMSTVERSALRAEGAVRSASQQIATSTDMAAQRSRLLGYQINDIGAQLASGTSPFLILAQQGGQVANALEGTAGTVGKLAAILSGPFGAAGLAAVSILGNLALNSLASADADDIHTKATKTLADAIRDMEAASRQAIQTGQRAIFTAHAEATAQLALATATREAIKAKLQLRIDDLKQARGTTFGAAGGAGAGMAVGALSGNVSALQSQLDSQDSLVQAAEANVRRTGLRIRQQAVEERYDAATKAANKYDRQLDLLNRRVERGDKIEGGYDAALGRLIQTRDREVEAAQEAERANRKHSDSSERSTGAARAHSTAAAAQAKAVREAAAAERELEQALTSVVRKYDPAAAAAADYAAELKKIAELEGAKKLTPTQAADYRVGAQNAFAKDRASVFTLESVEANRPAYEANEKDEKDAVKAAEDAQRQAEERAQHIREANIRTAADLYQDLFTDGTAAVWDDFRRIGFRVLAELLAKQTVGGGSGGIGGLAGLISGIFGGGGGNQALAASVSAGSSHALDFLSTTPGFASGGSMVLGGRAGVDQNLLSLNGQPLARVSAGETLNVAPNARAASGGGGTTIVHAPQFNLRGAIVTRELYADMQRISDQSAAAAGRVAYSQAMKDAPSAVARTRRFGTTAG